MDEKTKKEPRVRALPRTPKLSPRDELAMRMHRLKYTRAEIEKAVEEKFGKVNQ